MLEEDLMVICEHISNLRKAVGTPHLSESVEEQELEENEVIILSKYPDGVPSFEEVDLDASSFRDHVGVDGSSRRQTFSHCCLVMATATVVKSEGLSVLSYPDDYEAFSTEPLNIHKPAFAIKPSDPKLNPHSVLSRVRFRPPLIDYGEVDVPEGFEDMYWYTEDYNLKQMEDEVRSSLELEAFKHVISSSKPNTLVTLDGPLIPTPGVFKRASRALERFNEALRRGERRSRKTEYYRRVISYVDSWTHLIHEKSMALEEALSRGITPVGIVKRLERSKVVIRAEAKAGRLSKEHIKLYNDLMFLSEKLKNEVIGKHSSYKLMRYGPVETVLQLRLPQTTLEYFCEDSVLAKARLKLSTGLKKISYYLAMPSHPLVDDLSNFSFIRVEIPFEKKHESEKILSSVANMLTHQGEVALPRLVIAADSVCRKASASLFKFFYAQLINLAKVIPSYDTVNAMKAVEEKGGV